MLQLGATHYHMGTIGYIISSEHLADVVVKRSTRPLFKSTKLSL
jgi:hypothetical protein